MFGKVRYRLLFGVVFLFGSIAVFPQKAVTFSEPERLKIDNVENPGERDEESGEIFPITEAFYPIGFSPSGAFAYFVEPADEACGCYFAKLVIQDLKTDKILWQKNYEGDPSDIEPDKFTPNETITEHWKKYQTEYSKKLTQYGIRPGNEFFLETNAISYKNDFLTAKLDVNIKEYDVYSAVGDLNLWMISKQKGKKSLYSKKYTLEEMNLFRGAELAGVLKSPFESRAAVILVEMYRGYEGPPHITRVRIVGAALNSGFSK